MNFGFLNLITIIFVIGKLVGLKIDLSSLYFIYPIKVIRGYDFIICNEELWGGGIIKFSF